MEFASGGDMFEYVVKKNGLREEEARWFFQQLIVGLDYCHRMVRGGTSAAPVREQQAASSSMHSNQQQLQQQQEHRAGAIVRPCSCTACRNTQSTAVVWRDRK
jgi:serine/threonine protein kinase